MFLMQLGDLAFNLSQAVSYRRFGDGRVAIEFSNGDSHQVEGRDAARLWEWLEYQSQVRQRPGPGTPEAKILSQRLRLSRGVSKRTTDAAGPN